MQVSSCTLGEAPFNFDISFPFPAREREMLESAIRKIDITTPADIGRMEELLDHELSEHGYLWSKRDEEKCQIWKPEFSMTLDFFNEAKKIGIEVEKTEVKRIIHDILKLINGSLTFVPRIRYGVVIYPREYRRVSGKVSPFATRVEREVSFYFRRLLINTMLNDILLITYDFQSSG